MSLPADSLTGMLSAFKQLGRNVQVILSLLAVAIGAAAGAAAIGFRYAIDLVQLLGFGFGSEKVATLAAALPWWQLILVPTMGGLAIGLFVHYILPGRRPHGVADVIEANALRAGRMSATVGLKAAVVSAASIGVGASVGREGPVVHLGASIGAWVAKRLHLGRTSARTLLGCGVAAAVAASFNAPIAGAFFALEVVIGHYALTAFAPIVIASVTGTIISRMYYGDFPAFVMPAMRAITSFWELPAFALLGVISAIVAIVFIRAVFLAEDTVARLPVPPWVRPALGGLAVGLLAIAFPQILGVGYEATNTALSGLFPLWLLLVLVVAKTGATAISLGCGFGGGVFSPSLFIGAMVGGAFGAIATSAFPELSSGPGAYAMVGMGAMAGSVLGAPISTVLMIFELTSDYSATIAVMIAASIASLITLQVQGRAFFGTLLLRRGVMVRGGQEIGLLRAIRARDVMDSTYETITSDTPIAEVRPRLQAAPCGELFVVDADDRLTGIIAYSDMHEAAYDTSHDAEMTAKDVARNRPTVLQVDDDLEAAVKAYGASGEVFLPVVDHRDTRRIVGVAHEHKVMLAYHRALDQARAEERGEG